MLMGRKNRNARRRLRYQRPTIRVIKVNYAKLQGEQKRDLHAGKEKPHART